MEKKYREVHLKRLYGDLASVRDYVWRECKDKGEGIKFVCNKAEMYVEPWEVRNAKPGKIKFTSKYDGTEYSLVDFKWNPNQKKRMI